ncbi:hypothetical protein J6590_006064 [Homalodisca vitripennis]|nr:hypothetical protein J6590_006064 [Homalodisca vitripennis]
MFQFFRKFKDEQFLVGTRGLWHGLIHTRVFATLQVDIIIHTTISVTDWSLNTKTNFSDYVCWCDRNPRCPLTTLTRPGTTTRGTARTRPRSSNAVKTEN